MSVWGTSKPVVVLSTGNATLPRPQTRQEYPEFVRTLWTDVEDTLHEDRRGTRKVLEFQWTDLETSDIDNLVSMVNESPVTLYPWGTSQPGYLVHVTDYEPGFANNKVTRDTVYMQCKTKQLQQKLTTPDLAIASRRAGAVI